MLQDSKTMDNIMDELDRKVNGHRNSSKRARSTFQQDWQSIMFVSGLTQTNSTDSTYLGSEPTCHHVSVET